MVHAALAWFVRSEKLNGWVALGLMALAVIALGVGASSRLAQWVVGPRQSAVVPLVMVVVLLTSLGITVHDHLIRTGLLEGPSLFGFIGAPFIVVASVSSALAALRAARDRGRYRVLEKIGAGGMGE